MDKRFLTHGDLSWFELSTTDTEASKSFYSGLLGWNYEEAPMDDSIYTVIRTGDERIGGMMGMAENVPEDAPSFWGVYITVDNTDAVVEKAIELGGTVIVPATDVPDTGRFAVLQDPLGAVFSVIQYIPMDE